MPERRRPNFTFQFIILGIFLAITLSRIYVDWLWFGSLGYLAVYKTMLFTKILVGAAIAALFFLFLGGNVWIADRRAKLAKAAPYYSIAAGISVIAGFIGSAFWFVVPRFAEAAPFGFVEPLFKRDPSFYMMALPFYQALIITVSLAVLAALGLTLAAYFFSQKPKKAARPAEQPPEGAEQRITQFTVGLPQKGRDHLAVLFGVLLLAAGAFFWIRRYSLLFSHRGAVYGAGFTDVHVALPLYAILTLLALAAAGVVMAYPWHKRGKLLLSASFLVFGVFFGGMLVSGLVQALYVEPNEFNLEQQYIQENIKHTLYAYGLTDVSVKDFPVTYNLSAKDIAANKQMIDNIRLWDWRPLLTTYQQLQLFRTYYDFVDVDIDRYTINGRMTQLMTSPRELDQQQLDAKAKTWINEKLAYTHGYGVVTSPVNKISKEGLPDLFVQDIPPKSGFAELAISEPRIYFGEKTDSFIITDTKANEFDYPLGNDNVFTTYNGSDGILLNGLARKLAFSINLGSLNLMISSALTPDSTVLIRRNVVQRVKTLAPFLQYDSDPYIVIANGRLYWIIDAYSSSNRFPYSESTYGVNYIRNAVKVVVDAYNGDTSFYIVDKGDPLTQSYASIFPTLFRSFDDMPDALKQHIRYPEELFRIQNGMYGVYHMKDPQVFYNKEDVWQTPNEIYDREQVEMEPYYIILKLPEEKKEGFFLIRPLIPRGKDNMIAWMAASSDPDRYGTLEVFKLSKQELTYGPMQIEARINQDTDISQLFTLWGQQGSQVIRGNMIVIPIEHSFLYIEPVYLKASAGGALPQLKRVVVAYEDKLTMQPTLDEALQVLFGASTGKPQEQEEESMLSGTIGERFAQASRLYDEAQAALQQGDFATYAQKIEELGRILES